MRTSEEANYWGVMGAAWDGVMLNSDCQESSAKLSKSYILQEIHPPHAPISTAHRQ